MISSKTEKIFKYLAVALIALCLILSSSATPARADSEGAATITASALYMRAEPSVSASAITCLPRGTVVLVTDTGDDWYRVIHQGSEGYMCADYLDFTDTADAAFGTGTVTGNAVNLRSGPSTDNTVLGSRSKGDTLDVTGVSGRWYKISLNGSSAYIRSDYLQLADSVSADSSADTTGQSGVINGSYVRLRSGSSTANSILGTYHTGTAVTITGEDGDWYRVRCNGQDGYVYKPYVTIGGTASSDSIRALDDTTAHVVSAVHFRTGPDTTCTSRKVLSAGSTVTITGETDKWYRVRCDGEDGYVFKTYLSTGNSGADTPSEASRILSKAREYLGTPYIYGGSTPSGFDCSGFVYYVYRQCGYSVTRTAGTQNRDGQQVSRSELQPGDIVIFYNSGMTGIGHSGIYIGNDQFIHASSGQGKVTISELSSSYYDSHYYSARRILG